MLEVISKSNDGGDDPKPQGGLPPGAENLLDLGKASPASTLELVRIGFDAVPVIPFTPAMVPAHVHYLNDDEIRGFVHCNGEGCLLCAAGRKMEDRKALPVYLPAERRIGILLMSTSMRPGALLPQMLEHVSESVKNRARVVLFISKKDNFSFNIAAAPIRPDSDDGAAAIAQFMENWGAGRINPLSAIQTITPEQAKHVPSIARVLALKGGF